MPKYRQKRQRSFSFDPKIEKDRSYTPKKLENPKSTDRFEAKAP